MNGIAWLVVLSVPQTSHLIPDTGGKTGCEEKVGKMAIDLFFSKN